MPKTASKTVRKGPESPEDRPKMPKMARRRPKKPPRRPTGLSRAPPRRPQEATIIEWGNVPFSHIRLVGHHGVEDGSKFPKRGPK
eukprot:8631438-Pyramimonas_sp.AAC.1